MSKIDKSSRELIARLKTELETYQTKLTSLETQGLAKDLEATFLREGIEATSYRLEVERIEAVKPKRDMRFLSRNAPLRKGEK